MIIHPKKNRQERQLVKYFNEMSAEAQRSLLDFAAFLSTRAEPEETLSLTLQNIPRPANESVVKAIKRLVATYPMLDHSDMLNETSALMTEHVMQGRDAIEVIDDLEILFRTQYERSVL